MAYNFYSSLKKVNPEKYEEAKKSGLVGRSSGNTTLSSYDEEDDKPLAVKADGTEIRGRRSTLPSLDDTPSNGYTSTTSYSAPVSAETENPIKHSLEAYTPYISPYNDKFDTWLNSDYKLSKEEEKEAKKIVKDYYKANPMANTNNPNASAAFYNSLSDGQREELNKISALNNKVSNTASFIGGMLNATPGFKNAEDKLADKIGVDESASFSNQLANQQKQNRAAFRAGQFASKGAQYAMLNGAIENALGTGLSLAGRIGAGQLVDTVLDTIPTIGENIADKKYQNEDGSFDTLNLIKDTLDNQKENLAMNLGAEALTAVPKLVKNFKDYKGAKNMKGVNKEIDNAFNNFTVDQVSDSIGDEARAMARHERSNDFNYLMKQFNEKGHLIPGDSIADEAKALAQNAESNDLTSLMKQFNNEQAKEAEILANDPAEIWKRTRVEPSKVWEKIKAEPSQETFENLAEDNILRLQVEMGDGGDTNLFTLAKEATERYKATGDGNYYRTARRLTDQIEDSYSKELLESQLLPGKELPRLQAASPDPNVLDEELSYLKEDWSPKSNMSTSTPDTASQAVADAVKNVADNTNAKTIAETVAPEPAKTVSDIVNPNTEKQMVPSQTREKLVERGLASEEVANKYMPKEDYYHEKVNIDSTSKAAKDRVDEIGGRGVVDEVKFNLANAENHSLSAEQVYQLQHAYKQLYDSGDYIGAAKAKKLLQRSSSVQAQGMRAMRDWANETPEGMVSYSIALAKDKSNKSSIFNDAVDDMADALTSAIEKGDKKAAKEVLSKKLSDFAPNTRRAKFALKDKQIPGQMELWDFIEKEEAKGTPVANIMDEVESLLKKKAGVVSITPKQESAMVAIVNEMSKYSPDSYEYRVLQGNVADIIDKEMPTALGEQIKTTLYDNMLGNFKTGVTRNFGGNVLGNSLEYVQKPIKVGLDAAVGKATGKRNYAFGTAGEGAKGFWKGLKEQTKDTFVNPEGKFPELEKELAEIDPDFKLKKVATTRSGQNDMQFAIDNVSSAYKGSNVVSKGLNEYDKTVKGMMLFGDRPIYEAAYADAKAQLQKLVKKYGEDVLQTAGVNENALIDVDAHIEFLARERALEAVYQNKSLTADAFSEFKKGLSNLSKDVIGFDVLSQAGMPFMQVPGNIFSRTNDYLPTGIVKNALLTGAEMNKGNFNQRRFVDATSRNLTGLGLLGGATYLANEGRITGSYSKDPDRKDAQKRAGEQEYALVVGDKQYDVSDVPVLGTMAKAGAAFNESMDENNPFLENLATGTKKATSAALQNSTLQGLNRLLGTDSYSGDGWADKAANTVLTATTQGVPSIVRQVSQAIDPYKRDLGESGTLEYYKNNLINSTPFRGSLDIKTDREGNPVMNNDGRSLGARLAENLILPYRITEPQYSEVTQEANRIYDETGLTTAYIPDIKKDEIQKLKGFDESKYSYDLQRQVNNEYDIRTAKDAKLFMQSNFYNGLSDEQKASELTDLYNMEKAVSKAALVTADKSDEEIEALQKAGEIYVPNNSGYDAYVESGVPGYVAYRQRNADYRDAGLSNSTNSKLAEEMYQKDGKDGLDQYAKVKDVMNKYGYDMGNDKAREIYNTRGEEGLKEYKKYSDIFDDAGVDYNEKNVSVYNKYGKKGLEVQKSMKSVGLNKSGFKYLAALESPAYHLTDEEKGEFLVLNASHTKLMDSNDYADVYKLYRIAMDTPDANGDGKYSKKEYEAYVSTLGYDKDKQKLIVDYIKSLNR